MRGPPPKSDIHASELYARLAAETEEDRPFEVVDFPRKGPDGEPLGKVAIWTLKQREILAAQAEATRKTREYIREKQQADERIEGFDRIFDNICATEMLVRFCRDPERRKIPIFPNGEAVRALLTSDEMATLTSRYALTQLRLGPIVATMDDEEYEAWVTTIGEGGAAAPLHLLSWELRIHLLTRLARERWISRTANSSAGSPPDGPTSAPENTA